jgi:hypothetical protein
MPHRQRPDKTVAGSSKRHASGFYQLKTGHCLTGQYLNWKKKRPTAQCWWCPYRTQTREYCFKVCPAWKEQQGILWAEVRKETGRWKSRWKVQDLLADERCSRAVLDFLATTDVGRLVPAPAEGIRRASRRNGNSGSGESGRRREEQRLRSWAPGPRNRCFSARSPLWYLQENSRGRGPLSFVCPFCHSSFFHFGALTIFLGTAWAEGTRKLASCNESPAREQRRINGQKVRHHSLYRLNASMIKPKKKSGC